MSSEQASPCQSILENRSKYVDSLYTSCFKSVRNWVVTNSGTEDDAYDIFQEAFQVLFQNCKKEDFVLTSEPCTFLFAVSSNLWKKELERRQKVLKNKLKLTTDSIAYKDDPHMHRERLVAKYFLLIEERCRRILQLSTIEGLPGKEVTEQLEFKSYEYYRVAKKRCLDNFFKLLESDDQWNDLKR